jgi:hypothetical protein
MEVELTIFDSVLPVNALAIMRRIEEILKESKTNTTLALNGDALSRAQACILLLWEIAKFQSWDVLKEWVRLREELKPQLIAQKLSK